MIPIVLGVVIIVFTIMYLTPGDPVASMLGTNYTQESYAIKTKELGLDQPYIVQLWNYIKGIITKFDLGTSYITKRSVRDQIFERFKPTFIIGILSVLLSSIIAIPVGIFAARHHQKPLDYTVTTACVVFAAIPGFLLAIILMLIFCLNLRILPASGITSWKGYILPIICSIFGPMVSTCRMTRSSMLEVVRQDYIRTARAKGLAEGTIMRRHALKNALIPVLTMLGMHIGGALGGSILVETIYTVPGLGVLMKEAINNLDYPLVQGCVLFMAFIMCLMNLLTDLAYGLVDPRVHDQMSGGLKRKKGKTRQTEVAV